MSDLIFALIGIVVVMSLALIYMMASEMTMDACIKNGGFYYHGVHYRIYEVDNE